MTANEAAIWNFPIIANVTVIQGLASDQKVNEFFLATTEALYKRLFTQGNKHAADAGNASRHHGGKEDPSASPIVHEVPSYKIGGYLHRRADEEAQMRAHAQIGRVERQAVVDQGIG